MVSDISAAGFTMSFSVSTEATYSPVYRFWSEENLSHFYTISEFEKDYIIVNYSESTWCLEKIAWYAYPDQIAGTLPVYRFWSDQNQSHLYTISAAEKDYILATYPDTIWRLEQIAWFALP